MNHNINTLIKQIKTYLYQYKLIPYHEYRLKCDLSVEQVKTTILKHIEWNESFFYSGRNTAFRDYEGYIKGDYFIFRGIIKIARNSFKPFISGKIHEERDSTILNLKIHFHKWVTIFLVFWFLFLGTISILYKSGHNYEKDVKKTLVEQLGPEYSDELFKEDSHSINKFPFTIDDLIPFIFLILLTLYFNYELKILKKDIKQMLGGIEIKN